MPVATLVATGERHDVITDSSGVYFLIERRNGEQIDSFRLWANALKGLARADNGFYKYV